MLKEVLSNRFYGANNSNEDEGKSFYNKCNDKFLKSVIINKKHNIENQKCTILMIILI